MSFSLDKETQAKLIALNQKIQTCRQCQWVTYFSHDSIHLGKDNRILIIGESPTSNGWLMTGRAWLNSGGKLVPSGRVLQKLLDIVGLNLFDITFTEAAKCFPKDRSVLKTCTKNCRSFLEEQIRLLSPKIIITLGDHPTKSFLWNTYKKFSEVVWIPRAIELRWESYTLFPIYHPSPASPKSYVGNVPLFESLKSML